MFWQQVHQLDQHVSLAINSCHSSLTDPIWIFFSDKFVWIPMYAAIIGLLFWKLGWKKALFVLAGILLTFGFCDQFSNLIKNSVCRPRPLCDDFMLANGLHILEEGGGYGFFSAHAASSLGLAVSSYIGLRTYMNDLTQKVPWWIKAYGGWMFFWATMVGISRIFVGRHYLGDVLIGFLVGAAAGLAFSYLATYFIRKYRL